MKEPMKVDGVDYSAEGINDIRHQLAVVRTGALEQGAMEWAVVFTHAIALLAYLVELEGGEVDSP